MGDNLVFFLYANNFISGVIIAHSLSGALAYQGHTFDLLPFQTRSRNLTNVSHARLYLNKWTAVFIVILPFYWILKSNQIKSNQFIYQPAQVTKSSTKQLENILAKWPTQGLKEPLTCGQ